MVRLNLGCGTHILNGWLNDDLHHMDENILRDDMTSLRKIIEPVDEIYCAHALIYVPLSLDIEMFTRWYEILKPNGKIFIEEPENKETWENIKYIRTQSYLITILETVGFSVKPIPKPNWSRHGSARGVCLEATKL